MSVLVYIELDGGNVKKASIEAAAYASAYASAAGDSVTAVALGSANGGELAALGAYGVNKVLHVDNSQLNSFDAQVITKVLASAADSENAEVVVMSHNYAGKHISGRLSARLGAGLVAGAASLPDTSNGFVVKKGCFSGKGFGFFKITSDKKVLSIAPNSFSVSKGEGSASVEAFSTDVPANKVSVQGQDKMEGGIPLTEAELVVSAGRGLKGPENWGMVEEMAGILGAATACSRPVSDIGWRPHHEHVGQTGIAIAPNLYIAIGISGAIQHLAGVNQSKTIVVINKDPEAPFFKAADYGIVGDAFEVIPKLNEALKNFKASNN